MTTAGNFLSLLIVLALLLAVTIATSVAGTIPPIGLPLCSVAGTGRLAGILRLVACERSCTSAHGDTAASGIEEAGLVFAFDVILTDDERELSLGIGSQLLHVQACKNGRTFAQRIHCKGRSQKHDTDGLSKTSRHS